ncbi:MAG TPA: DeoR family transcriptional regulator [Thermomicrobiales bacterium]|nr:DeoR family transcriptional regulator [Thermomicrobiales bacterium]
MVDVLREHGTLSVAELVAEVRVAWMTARRDFDVLEQHGQVRRIGSGAVPPKLSADEDSFQRCLARATPAKERLPAGTTMLVSPSAAGSLNYVITSYHVGRRAVAGDRWSRSRSTPWRLCASLPQPAGEDCS